MPLASGTAASIIAQSLPEVLNDRSIATGREQFDKRELKKHDNRRNFLKRLPDAFDEVEND